MNINRNFKHWFAVTLILALLLTQTVRTSAAAVDCDEVMRNAAAVLTSIDIPNQRGEYAALDRIAECAGIAAAQFVVPVTGNTQTSFEKFMAFKDRQAEMLDRSPASQLANGYQDEQFQQYKLRQAEQMMP